MTFAWSHYAIPHLFASLVVGFLAAYVIRHRDSSVGPPLTVMLCSVLVWMLLESLLILGTDLRTKSLLGRACYPAIVLIGPTFLEVIRRYIDAKKSLPPSMLPVMWGVPILTVGVILFDDIPGVLYREFSVSHDGAYARRVIVHGPWFWVVVCHAYGLIAWSTLLFIRHSIKMRSGSADILQLGIAIAAPWAAVTARITGLSGDIDPTPFGFQLMGLGIVFSFKRLGLLGHLLLGRRVVLDALGEGVVVTDTRGHLIDLNLSARKILSVEEDGVTSREIATVLGHHPKLMSALAACDRRALLPSRLDSAALGEIEIDGHTFDIRASSLLDARGHEVNRILSLRDVTERKRVEEAFARESIYVRLIQEVTVAANEATSSEAALEESLRLICDACGWSIGHVFQARGDGRLEETGIRYLANRELAAIWDLPEIIGPPADGSLPHRVAETQQPSVFGELPDDMDNPRLAAARRFGLRAVMAMPVTIGNQTEAVLECGSGQPFESEPELLRVLSHLGELLGRAIERKANEERIRDLAFYDPLTGLPNRELFRRRLTAALEHSERCGRSAALLFVDLNGFKLINDSLGHSAGDALLREVADRFVSCLRPSDVVGRSADDTPSISRLGGDEFTVLLTGLSDPHDAALVARRLSQSLSSSLVIEGCEVFSGASIGIALYPQDARDADELLRNADRAMYVAKHGGAVGYRFYKDSMNRASRRSLDLESRLRRALETGALHLHYQAQRDTKTGRVVGAEALARWREPELGEIGPDEFIPIAERNGLIIQIGTWVLQQSCLQSMLWRDAGYAPIRMAVNVSGHQIRTGELPSLVEHTLAQTDMLPSLLELEITESAIAGDDPVTRESLQQLHDMGISLALDDFGTGSSSLTHLRTFPIDRLKIDRSFVVGIEENGDDAALTAAVIAMAHGLRLTVVAEGVDSEAQAEFLASKQCDELQGYLFSRPVPPEEFERFLEREKDPEMD